MNIARSFITSVVRPLQISIKESAARIVGISGAAGAGKTTLANLLCSSAITLGRNAICLSLDDFCFGQLERKRRLIKWRAAPGSHDTNLLDSCLMQLARGITPVYLPIYDKLIDDRRESRIIKSCPDLILIDGWFIGLSHQLYESAWKHIDLHVHLDISIELAKQRRFEREAILRAKGGGLSPEQMNQFWSEVLEPISLNEVKDAGSHAQIIIQVKETFGQLEYSLLVNRT